MEVQMVVEGLWRWSARHPEWKPGEGWDADVWCVYAETADAVVLIDPLVPEDEPERFWRALDRDVERLGLPVAVLLTCSWHGRSAGEVTARYGAAASPPAGVEAIPVWSQEVVFWLPGQSALVAGDALLDMDGALALQPESWLDGEQYAPFVRAVERLLELPVERVLPSHGAAVLENGRAAIERALRRAGGAGSPG
jgi:glyoxylase-like metal-dependent hydrolase (beta-lactamase superfamily II)